LPNDSTANHVVGAGYLLAGTDYRVVYKSDLGGQRIEVGIDPTTDSTARQP
jgi:hypothetical protein